MEISQRIACLAWPAVFCFAFVCGAAEYKNVQVGGLELTAFLDESGATPVSLFINAGEESLNKYAPAGSIPSYINAFVLTLPEGGTVLFDTGLGEAQGGKLSAALHAAGLSPDDIDNVVITHMHGDHIGGLLNQDAATFPRATVHIAQMERDWWFSEENRAAAPEIRRGGFDRAKAALAPYEGRVRLFRFDDEILPGVTAIDATGHTPGHTAFRIAAGTEDFLIIGDLIHAAPVQFPEPLTAIAYDNVPLTAVKARMRIFTLAAAENLPIVGMHLPFPGVGRLRKAPEGFAFDPIE